MSCGERPRDGHPVGVLLESFVATRFPSWSVAFLHGACDAILEYKPTEVVLFVRGLEPAEYREIAAALERELPQTGLTVVGSPPSPVPPSGSKPPVLVPLAAGLPDRDIADAVLSAWGAPGAVTEVVLDVLAAGAAKAENTMLHDLEIHSVLSWSQDDGALPAPVLSGASRELLRVRGLPEPRYLLTIDGEKIATFWREQLETGIDLATLRTPMARQADAVHQLTVQRAALDRAPPRAPSAGASEQESAILLRRREAAQPRTRDYELQPAVE